MTNTATTATTSPRLSTLDRLLPVWIGLAMALGLALVAGIVASRSAPATNQTEPASPITIETRDRNPWTSKPLNVVIASTAY